MFFVLDHVQQGRDGRRGNIHSTEPLSVFEVSQPGLRAANFQVSLHSYFFVPSFSPVACFIASII